jgi:hypothetical protein
LREIQLSEKYKQNFKLYVFFRKMYPGCPPFGEGEIQGLFQDFQAPFSVNSRT